MNSREKSVRRASGRGWKVSAGAVVALAALLSPAAGEAQVNAEQVLAIGRNVLSMEDYMLSIQYFNQAIKAKPYLADPYFFRGLAKLSLDDYKGAEEDCTLALARNRFKTEAYKVRGFARQQMGLDSLAVCDYETGLEYDPTDRYFLFYKAVAETELKRYQAADSTFGVLLRRHPRFYEAVTARGHLNLERGDTLAALADIEQSIRLAKSQINPYLMRAEINATRSNWEAALADMDEVIRMQPAEPGLYINRAYVRYNNDDYFGAMADYNYAIDLQPDNTAALFNRALLRFEVRELESAANDFTAVLTLDKDNFHALYNRALVYLKMNQPGKAMPDLQAIARRYPRFYPVYYAMAQCRQEMGDMKGAVGYMNKADDIVRRYVENPDANQLDRPTISKVANKKGRDAGAEESETDVMERFNQLVTNADVADTRLDYKERIKGRVQDRNVSVDPEPAYALSFQTPEVSLRSVSNYFRELDNLNQRHYIPETLHLVAGLPSGENAGIEEAFRMADAYTALVSGGAGRPVDYLARGVVYTYLKNYDSAIADFDKAIALSPDFTVAYMGRGYAAMCRATSRSVVQMSRQDAEDSENSLGLRDIVAHESSAAIRDFDKALELNPRLVYAWFNKGNIYLELEDLTSAIQCYATAIEIDPDFGQAYFNRGLAYLKAGNRSLAFSDLSKAGELGVLPSYNILKRMNK